MGLELKKAAIGRAKPDPFEEAGRIGSRLSAYESQKVDAGQHRNENPDGQTKDNWKLKILQDEKSGKTSPHRTAEGGDFFPGELPENKTLALTGSDRMPVTLVGSLHFKLRIKPPRQDPAQWSS